MVWKVIISSREAVFKWACFKLGNGLSINPWIPRFTNHIPKLKGVNGESWTRVINLRTKDGLNWDANLLYEICKLESAQAILDLDWPQGNGIDTGLTPLSG